MPTYLDPENDLAILVDEARWPWRGTKWCHLVSDDNFAELHAFARALGQRRVGFQGDHYDIDIETRKVALENGARPVESREIVARMKAAGLRRRPSNFVKWQLAKRSDVDDFDGSEISQDPVFGPYLDISTGWFVLVRQRQDGSGEARGVVLFGNDVPEGVVLPEEDPEVGLFSRVDADGNFSIERVTPPPSDRE